MSERVAFRVNIRCDAVLRAEEMIPRVEAALGFSLRKGTNYGMSAWVGSVLGMKIVLDEWRGVSEAPIYRMFGEILDNLFVDAHLAGDKFEFVDISQGVIGVLDMSGAGEWRLPSKEESAAEFAWMKKADPDE